MLPTSVTYRLLFRLFVVAVKYTWNLGMVSWQKAMSHKPRNTPRESVARRVTVSSDRATRRSCDRSNVLNKVGESTNSYSDTLIIIVFLKFPCSRRREPIWFWSGYYLNILSISPSDVHQFDVV